MNPKEIVAIVDVAETERKKAVEWRRPICVSLDARARKCILNVNDGAKCHVANRPINSRRQRSFGRAPIAECTKARIRPPRMRADVRRINDSKFRSLQQPALRSGLIGQPTRRIFKGCTLASSSLTRP